MKTDGNARPCESMGYDRCQCTQKCRFSRTGKKSQGFVHWDAEFEDLTKTIPQSNTHTGIKTSKSFTVCVLITNLLNIMLLHETRNSRLTVILNSMPWVHFEPSSNVELVTNQRFMANPLSFFMRNVIRLGKNDVPQHNFEENRLSTTNRNQVNRNWG